MTIITAPNRITYQNNGHTLSELIYQEPTNGIITADHTHVHPNHRGQGIAAQLLDTLVEEARAHHWKIQPSCRYIATAIARQPEKYRDIIA